MDLLKYLVPMKNLPERFSNLAFWRGVRKLRDEVVTAFEYVDSWGENIESDIDLLQSKKVTPHYSKFGDYSQTSTNSDHWFLINLITGNSTNAVASSIRRNSANMPNLESYNNVLPLAILSIPCAVNDSGHIEGHSISMIVHLEIHDGVLYNIESLCPNMNIPISNNDISKVVYTIPGYAGATTASLQYFTID